MSPTVLLIGLVAVLFIASNLLWFYMLRLGLRLVKAEPVRMRRVFGIGLLALLISGLVVVGLERFAPADEAEHRMFGYAMIVVGAFVACVVIAKGFSLGIRRAFLAWLPTNLAYLATIGVALVVRQYAFEAFVTPTNSMAPTVLGLHCTDVCPQCGAAAYYSPPIHNVAAALPHEMICENFHLTRSYTICQPDPSRDRIVVAKYLEPQRWDVVAFRLPSDPSVTYIKRIVGLPGETIVIKEGAVWVDGQRLSPPTALGDIQYLSKIEGVRQRLWGTEGKPAVLGDDEFFVLGDFASRALDSRLWETGAPGRQPYAVPKSHIIGVLTNTYWPPERWRSFR
jgi:signal peptidase I